jgi:hypothetical protein
VESAEKEIALWFGGAGEVCEWSQVSESWIYE